MVRLRLFQGPDEGGTYVIFTEGTNMGSQYAVQGAHK